MSMTLPAVTVTADDPNSPWPLALCDTLDRARRMYEPLMPFPELLKALTWCRSPEQVANVFGVSEAMVLLRLRTLCPEEWEDVRSELTVTAEQRAS